MKKRLLLTVFSVTIALVGMVLLMTATSQPCLACTAQTPPSPCGVNLSAITINQNDAKDAWWSFLAPRDERVAHVYLGLNNNKGTSNTSYTYQIAYGGDWDPGVAGVVTPTVGSGQLGPAGSQGANDTIEISVPYSLTQSGNLVITATVQSSDGLCIFRTPVTTTLRLNDLGPTVWPITPRTCPKAGAKPPLTFGVRNPTDSKETYSVVARAYNPLGGTASDQFSLNGQGATVNLEPLTLRPGQSKQVKIDCETFGYCMTGGENQVRLEVSPVSNSDVEAVAWSNVTIRDPESVCPEVKDWWFFMPPALMAGLIGIPSAAAALGGGAYAARRKSKNSPGKPKSRDPIGGKDVTTIVDPQPSGQEIDHGKPRKRS